MRVSRIRRTQGFTLIELLVVIAIIGLLMALILPAVQKIRGRGDVVKAQSQINQIATACTQFKADNGMFPPQNAAEAATVLQTWYPGRYTGTSYAPPGVTTPNQYMVLFLQGPSGTGWAIDLNAGNPVAPGATATSRKGPWMTFQPNELSSGSVIDPWGTPLQYFASTVGGAYTNGSAYKESTVKWINHGGVQIISAGPNRSLGNGPTLPSPGTPGADDLANFNGGYQLSARP